MLSTFVGAARRPASGAAAAIGLALVAALPTVAGAGYYVATTGSDANPGTIARPWRKVGPSIGKLRAGDTLYVRAGRYHESATAAVSGTAAQPIVVRAYPGETAILDAAIAELQTPGNGEWELVNAATGEYRTRRAYGSGPAYGYVVPPYAYENGRVALVPYEAAIHFRAATDQYNATAFYVGPGTFMEADGRIHVRLAKTADLRATEARYGPVFPVERPDPDDYAIFLSVQTRALRVTGSHLVFLGLHFEVAQNTIELGANAHHVRFEGITAWAGDRAIEAEESGIHHVTVTGSRLYGDHPYWVFWSDMKDAPYPADLLRATTIDLRAGTHDWEISYNHVRGSGQDLLGTADAEYNLSIHHNRFENAGDDALELEGSLGRTEVYENFFLNCLTAVAPGQDSPGFQGPLFVYRNVMAALRDPPVNRAEGINTWNGGGRFGYEYMLKQNGTGFGTRDAHVYHNTMVLLNSDGRGINLTPQNPQGTRVANNLLVTVNGPVNGSYRTGPDQVVDGNLYWKVNTVESTRLMWSYDHVAALHAATGLEAHGLGSVPKRGTDPRFAHWPLQVVDPTRTRWQITPASERATPVHFFLGSSSPARAAGIVIPPHPTLGPLPDSRSSRDLGAIPYGTPASEYQRFPFDPAAPPGLADAPGPAPAAAIELRLSPHPVRGRALLRFALPREGPARVEILDLQGRRVRTLLEAPRLPAGTHSVAVEAGGGGGIRAGVYFCRVVAGAASAAIRMTVVE